MKKKALFVILLFVVSFCFAERRTRVDTYKNYTIKIIWDDNHWNPNDNWAKQGYGDGYATWDSVIEYTYILNPTRKIKRAEIRFYTGRYHYAVTASVLEDGMWDKIYDEEFYNYNVAKKAFDLWASLYEKDIY